MVSSMSLATQPSLDAPRPPRHWHAALATAWLAPLVVLVLLPITGDAGYHTWGGAWALLPALVWAIMPMTFALLLLLGLPFVALLRRFHGLTAGRLCVWGAFVGAGAWLGVSWLCHTLTDPAQVKPGLLFGGASGFIIALLFCECARIAWRRSPRGTPQA
jgi:hypothetical protein